MGEEDWNIDDYQAAHESEEHWALRRKFMEVNKSRFPRIRVLSLSQVFANMEFLGCKYPPETMELVAELSEGIVEEYRQKQKGRLQRTFVKASTAAENKSKGGEESDSIAKSTTEKSSSSAKAKQSQSFKRPLMINFVRATSPLLSSDPPNTNTLTNKPSTSSTSPDKTKNVNQMRSFTETRSPNKPVAVVTGMQAKSQPSKNTKPSTSQVSPQKKSPPQKTTTSPNKPINGQGWSQNTFGPGANFKTLEFRSTVRSTVSSSSLLGPIPNRPPVWQPQHQHQGPYHRPRGPNAGGGGGFRFQNPTSFQNQQQRKNGSATPAASDLQGLVLVEQLYSKDSSSQILNRSCAMSHKTLVFKALPNDSRGHVCSILIGNHYSVEGVGPTKEEAKIDASEIAVNKLRKVCYTIQIKQPIVGSGEVKKDKLSDDGTPSAIPSKDTFAAAPAIDQNNIGNKMLRLMGWTGGALGKNEDGIQEAIDVSDSIGRQRLGLGSNKSTTLDQARVFSFLQQQIATTQKEDVIFSPEFSIEERGVIHKAASILGLKSRSYGKGDDRFLVISRKVSLCDLLKEILASGETAKYRVIPPCGHENLKNLVKDE